MSEAEAGHAEAHGARVARLQAQLAAAPEVRLAKRTSNLFRDRVAVRAPRLDVRDFDHVLAVDAAAGWVDAEGMVPYDALADACLAHGVMPAVVPQLKSITLGGAVAGVGIEATSFRHGLVHETVLALDVLTGDGRVVAARPDNEHADLFYGFPNSYGTLGYALRVRARTLLELIVNNTAWLRAPEVRRALLGNLRLTADMIPRVLRLLPKHELRVVPQQTAYPAAVRDAARRMLKES